jgi:hypothetical protein
MAHQDIGICISFIEILNSVLRSTRNASLAPLRKKTLTDNSRPITGVRCRGHMATENHRKTRWRGGSCRLGRQTLLQEAADRGITLETDCDFVRVAGFATCACLGQQLRARRPVGLIFREPHIGGYLL